jgi:hypothetical protein
MRVDLDEHGIAELANDRYINDALYDFATRARNLARMRSPHRTGHYAASMYARKGKGSAEYGATDFKAWWIEFGTGHPGPTRGDHTLIDAARDLGMRVEAKHR